MPLIMVTGFPTSGKSTRAKQLHAYLDERIKETSNGVPPQVPPALNFRPDAFDIALGVRLVGPAGAYPLRQRFGKGCASNHLRCCQARAAGDTNCTANQKPYGHRAVFFRSDALPDKAKEVNQERLRRQQEAKTAGQHLEQDDESEAPYAPENWDNLVFRYEEPNAMTRWDSPLFTLLWDDDEEQTKQTFNSLWDAVAGEGRKVVKPNQATVQRSRDAGGDYLYTLDRETQDIVKGILDQQSEEGGDDIRLPKDPSQAGGDELIVELPAGRKTGLPQLQRMRRAYMNLNRGGIGLEMVGNLSGSARIRDSFVRYLNDAFEREG
ncbi:uncharacterized protein PG998_008082 [Apiospora kogelbergensis]|uniref:uncharacterized protein n=1 Tax=Apiospora kogelbergensis TaxID=1337665 RepID=UPI00312E61DD